MVNSGASAITVSQRDEVGGRQAVNLDALALPTLSEVLHSRCVIRSSIQMAQSKGRERGREGGRERGREGGREEGGRERGREGGREGGRGEGVERERRG